MSPTYEGKDYCLDAWIAQVSKLTYKNRTHLIIDNSPTLDYYNKLKVKLEPLGFKVVRVERGNNSREALARAQNFARKMALEEGYDYLFSLESDIFPPTNVIEGLMAWGKDVVTGLYLIGDKNIAQVPCITLPQYHEYANVWGTRLLKPEEFNDYLQKGLKQVQAGGMGVCLMSRRALLIQPFMYDSRFKGHSDIYFFSKMQASRIPVWVDTDMVCDHQNSNWSTVKDR